MPEVESAPGAALRTSAHARGCTTTTQEAALRRKQRGQAAGGHERAPWEGDAPLFVWSLSSMYDRASVQNASTAASEWSSRMQSAPAGPNAGRETAFGEGAPNDIIH